MVLEKKKKDSFFVCIVNSLFGVYVSSKQKAKRHCRCIFVFITSDIVIATFNTYHMISEYPTAIRKLFHCRNATV